MGGANKKKDNNDVLLKDNKSQHRGKHLEYTGYDSVGSQDSPGKAICLSLAL